TATPAVSMSGCVLTLRFCSCSGPDCASSHMSRPSTSLASSKVPRTTRLSAKPFIMPTDWEPCPGKTNAYVIAAAVRSDTRENRAPGEPSAHALHQYEMPGADAAVAHGEVVGERDRCRRGIGVLVHRHHDLLHRQLQAARGRL